MESVVDPFTVGPRTNIVSRTRLVFTDCLKLPICLVKIDEAGTLRAKMPPEWFPFMVETITPPSSKKTIPQSNATSQIISQNES